MPSEPVKRRGETAQLRLSQSAIIYERSDGCARKRSALVLEENPRGVLQAYNSDPNHVGCICARNINTVLFRLTAFPTDCSHSSVASL